MRTLLPPPSAILDPATRAPRVGSYRGGLPRVDLAPLGIGAVDRVLKHKRWLYLAIASEQMYLAAAVVRFGYVANVFAFAFDKASRRMLAHRTALGPPFAATVGEEAGEGCSVRLPGVRIHVARARGETAYAARIELPDLRVRARLESAGAPPAISAIVPIPGGVLDATEKRALLSVTGEATVRGQRISLDGALAGYDYTNGLFARRTTWRWAFALGRARSGERIGLNLTEGLVGEAECALWLQQGSGPASDELCPLAEGRFTFSGERPLDPWHVRTADGAVDLRFVPGAMHADNTDLRLVRARFVQPVGLFSGSVRTASGRTLELDDVLGVTEDQDVLW